LAVFSTTLLILPRQQDIRQLMSIQQKLVMFWNRMAKSTLMLQKMEQHQMDKKQVEMDGFQRIIRRVPLIL